MTSLLSYPDLLGYVTGGVRFNLSVAQVAAAVRPPEGVRAGQVIPVVVIAQNMLDDDIDLTATVHIPDVDARRNKGKFSVKTPRYVVGMKAAEVGILVIPVSTTLDITPADGYTITIDFESKPTGKSRERIRSAEGGSFDPSFVPPDALKKLNTLKDLKYEAQKRMGRSTITLTFSILPARLNQPVDDIRAGWISICKLADYTDPRFAMYKFADLITTELLPRLRRDTMFRPLVETTKARFAKAGYALRDAEALLIARLMALILEYAAPSDTAHGFVIAGHHNIKALLMKDPRQLDSNLRLPRWFQAMIGAIGKDVRAASAPAQVIPQFVYDELLYDAILYGFDLVTGATGEDLGSQEEMREYARQNIDRLNRGGMDFSRVYLPLVLGGILINDKLLMDKEEPAALLVDEGKVLEDRMFEIADDDMPIHEMANQLIMQMGQRYGFYR